MQLPQPRLLERHISRQMQPLQNLLTYLQNQTANTATKYVDYTWRIRKKKRCNLRDGDVTLNTFGSKFRVATHRGRDPKSSCWYTGGDGTPCLNPSP